MNNKIGLSVFFGVIIGALFCVLNIMISLKTGLGFGGEQIVAIIGFLLLYVFAANNRKNINVLQSTACGAFLAMFSIDSAIAACAIYNQTSISFVFVCIMGIAGLMMGFFAAYFLAGTFIDRKAMPFPIGKATADTILTLTNNNESNSKFLYIGIAVSICISVPVYVLGLLPDTLSLAGILRVPSFIGISISPLLFGLGFLIGSRTSISMAWGAITSIILWGTAERANAALSYNEHLNNKWVISLAISTMLISSFLPLFSRDIWKKGEQRNRERSIEGGKENLHNKKLLVAAFVTGSICVLAVIFWYITNNYLLTAEILIVIAPVSILGIIFCCNSAGETGLAPITPLGIISFILLGIFVKDFRSVMYGGAFVCAVASAAVTMINSFKTAEILKVERKLIFIATMIGGFFGVIIGTITLFAISKELGFGTETLSAPVSVTWGAIVSSISNGSIPENINIAICLLGIISGIVLGKIGVSVICFGVGVMISPALTITIFLGGACRKAIELKFRNNTVLRDKKIEKGELVMSGLIIGEGIALMVMFIKIFLT